MDKMILDPDSLEFAANSVEEYITTQEQIMNEYFVKVNALFPDWNDEKTLGSILEEIRQIKNNFSSTTQAIREIYPPYFREKANSIRALKPFDTTNDYAVTRNGTYQSIKNQMKATSLVSNHLYQEGSFRLEALKNTFNDVRVSSNIVRINKCVTSEEIFSPRTGEKLLIRSIAWRPLGNELEANSENICAVEFVNAKGTFVCYYTGRNWDEIVENNRFDMQHRLI